MRIEKSILTLTVVFLSPALAVAQEASDQGSNKMAFVDTAAVLEQTEEGKQQLAKLDEYIAQKRQEVEAKAAELQNLQNQFQSQSRLLNADTRAEMGREIAQKERELKRLREDIQVDIGNRQNRLLTTTSERIKEVVAEYARSEGIGAVFVKDPAVPFISPAIEITDAIVAAYNAKYPVTGSAEASP